MYQGATGDVIVVMPAGGPNFAPAQAAALGFAVRQARSDHTEAEIAAIKARLREFRTEITPFGDNGYGWYYDARTDRVVIDGTFSPEVFAPIIKEFPGAVIFRHGEGGLDSREADTEPFWGGARVKNLAGMQCTTGFKVKPASGASARYLVTAAHCFAVDDTLKTPPGVLMGVLLKETALPKDYALIWGQTYGATVYLGAAGVNAPGTVIGAGNFALNFNAYCREAAFSYESCNETALSINAEACWSDGCRTKLAALTGGTTATGGDSGGPWLVKSTGGTQVYIRGVHIGHLGTTDYAQQYGDVAAHFGVTISTQASP